MSSYAYEMKRCQILSVKNLSVALALILICFLYSVGSTFSSIKPQSLIYVLGGWISAPLGDHFRIRHEHTPTE